MLVETPSVLTFKLKIMSELSDWTDHQDQLENQEEWDDLVPLADVDPWDNPEMMVHQDQTDKKDHEVDEANQDHLPQELKWPHQMRVSRNQEIPQFSQNHHNKDHQDQVDQLVS